MIRKAANELREHWREPYWWHHRFWGRAGQALPAPGCKPAIDWDWDVLLVLDGCRYDTFVENIGEFDLLRGRTHTHWSQGSTSDEWIAENFADRDCSDLAVVTANPYYQTMLPKHHFGAVDHVWRDERWDEELGTVWPGEVAAAARKMAARHPYKRLVVHFMQPHYPFIGNVMGGGAHGIRSRAAADGGTRPSEPVWSRALRGEIAWDDVRDGYRENLRLVLSEVADLVPDLRGKVVITADHGNAFGETILGIPLAGHPPAVPHWTLRKVPWHFVGKRHDIPTAKDF